MEKRGSQTLNKKSNFDPYWDIEIFRAQMKNLRGWTVSKCDQFFNELVRASPPERKDMGGPPEHPQRVQVSAGQYLWHALDTPLTPASTIAGYLAGLGAPGAAPGRGLGA